VPLVHDGWWESSGKEAKLGACDGVHIGRDLDRGGDEALARFNAANWFRLWCRIPKSGLRPVAKTVCQQCLDGVCPFALAVSPSLLYGGDLFFVSFESDVFWCLGT
jgi:hypothetical protein